MVTISFADARKSKGLSQRKIAEMLGISPPSVFAWEHQRATPSFGRALQIEQLLALPVEYWGYNRATALRAA